MVTLYDLGVTLKFRIGYTHLNVVNVAESADEHQNSDLTNIVFKEYENVGLMFESESNEARIYFDGIEMLPEELCEIDDDGNLYLKPKSDGSFYPIFEYATEFYAMRVGTFEIRIYCNNKVYYQWFSVLPKNVKSDEWSIMQQELEREVQGLSSDIIRKNISLGSQHNEVAPSQELYKFFVIKRHFNSILAALIDLKDKPNYKIEKIYKLDSLFRATYIDHVTVKDYLKKGTGEEKYLVPKRIYNYDLPENRWLKRIITIYEKEVIQFIKSTESYIGNIRTETLELKKYIGKNKGIIVAKENAINELESYLTMARTILNISDMIKTQEWYKQIRGLDSITIPHVMIYDVRYNAFYKMYKELEQDFINIQWNNSYSYSWKLSSRMYEIWSYIKICRFMISDNIGFDAKGWLFDEFKKERILIPDLLPGTKVVFEKSNFVVKLYFDATITKNPDMTNLINMPVFSKNRHNRPDLRMDLYKDNIYWSSLIFEVKYRTIRSFWESQNCSCKDQIRAYKNDVASKFCRGLDPDFVVRKVKPVDRVWILNPTHDIDNVVDKGNEGIKFVQLIPGMNYEQVMKELLEEINKAFDGQLI